MSRRYTQQDRLHAAFQRLEGKDTQNAAWAELQLLVKELELAALSTLLHAAGTQTAASTTFSRIHGLRIAALCCMPAACVHAGAMLQAPLLPKLLALLARSLRDGDQGVRAAAAESFGIVAGQLAASQPGTEACGGTDTNPLLASLLDALGEPGGGTQAAAASALAQAADHISGLDPALLRGLLRAANNPLFLGRAELWGAVARLEDGRVRGLVAGSFRTVLAAWPDVLGSAGAEGSGLLGALTAKGKDFALRAAAAHTLKALAVGAGPYVAGASWEAAAAALKTAKTDISKPVREAAAAAAPVVAGLLEFMAAAAPVEQWPEAAGGLLAAGGGKRSSPGGGRPPKAAPLAVKAEPQEPQAAPAHLIPAVYPTAPPAVATLHHFAAAPLAAPAPDAGSVQQLAAQLASVQEQQAQMAQQFAALAASTQSALQQVQLSLAAVSAGVAALAASTSAPQAAQLQQGLASAQHALASLGAGAAGGAAAAAGSPKRLSSLNRSYQALEQDLHKGPSAASPAAAAACPAASLAAAAGSASAALPPTDWEATYAQLLQGGDRLRLLRCLARSGAVWERLSAGTAQLLLEEVAALLEDGKALKHLMPSLWPLADSASPAGQAAATWPPAARARLLAALSAYLLPAAPAEPAEGSKAAGALGLGEQRDLLASALAAVWG